MRRPAQHRHQPGANTWAHPYTGVAGMSVFYNDGGNPPAPAAGEPKTVEPPKPGPPPVAKEFTQEDLERVAAREKAQGKRSALKEFAEEHGFSSPEDAATFIAAARQAQQDALTEQERQAQQLAADRAKLEQERSQVEATRRTLKREQALTRLGALDTEDAPNLQDALAMLDRDLRDQPDADDASLNKAAAALKARRPELFGTKAPETAPPAVLPPAPGGAPAGGGTPRVPATKDDVKARAHAKAVKMGFAKPDAA